MLGQSRNFALSDHSGGFVGQRRVQCQDVRLLEHTFELPAVSSTSAEIRVALPPTLASYSAIRVRRAPFGSVGTSSTEILGSATRSATPSGSISSVTRTL